MNASLLKRWIVGKPMPLAQARHERLSKTIALAVFSSDALSSVAYATEEILLVLVLAGAAAVHLAVPVALAISCLLLVVAVSYQQTIHAYPSGGGSYIVARANLGATPGLIAAAALLTDYVLTVSVSVAAGVAALTSAVPGLYGHRVALGVGFIELTSSPTCVVSTSPAASSRCRPMSSSSPSPSWSGRACGAGSRAISRLCRRRRCMTPSR
jgi:amino acid transporter